MGKIKLRQSTTVVICSPRRMIKSLIFLGLLAVVARALPVEDEVKANAEFQLEDIRRVVSEELKSAAKMNVEDDRIIETIRNAIEKELKAGKDGAQVAEERSLCAKKALLDGIILKAVTDFCAELNSDICDTVVEVLEVWIGAEQKKRTLGVCAIKNSINDYIVATVEGFCAGLENQGDVPAKKTVGPICDAVLAVLNFHSTPFPFITGLGSLATQGLDLAQKPLHFLLNPLGLFGANEDKVRFGYRAPSMSYPMVSPYTNPLFQRNQQMYHPQQSLYPQYYY